MAPGRALRDGQRLVGVTVEPLARTPKDVRDQDLGIEPRQWDPGGRQGSPCGRELRLDPVAVSRAWRHSAVRSGGWPGPTRSADRLPGRDPLPRRTGVACST